MRTNRAPAAPRLAATLALALALAAAGCGGGSGGSGAPATSAKPDYAGSVANPPQPAPPLRLTNSVGKPVDIRSFRGRAVQVTFLYAHCPDVCPLIVGNLHTALSELGPDASKVEIIAVSTDPEGDTPQVVNSFLKARRMTGKMDYLLGSRSQLEKTWADWNVIAKGSKKAKNADLVEHSALIYGITGSGRLETLYPANFKPAQIVHDVPLLASQ